MNEDWIGIDLDGTLAHYDGWVSHKHIGKPVNKMLKFTKRLIAEGHTVKIFTARVTNEKAIPYIKKWLKEHGLPDLEITNVKDYRMVVLYDDRCRQVIENTGVVVK